MSKLLISTTWGPTDPTRAGLAFTYAMVAHKKGEEVELFLFHDGVLSSLKELREKMIPIGPPPVTEVWNYLEENNVKVYLCNACFDLRGLSQENLPENCEVVGMDKFVELSNQSKSISF